MQSLLEKPSLIQKARIERGLTRAQVGVLLKVTEAAVGHWERGIRKPDPRKAPALAKLLHVDLDRLVREVYS